MESVSVQIDGKWARVVRSPAYWLVSALSGVSVTFFPLFFLELGKMGREFFDWQVLLLWIATVGVAVVHYRMSAPVMRALRDVRSSAPA
jgi:hypothetical protein